MIFDVMTLFPDLIDRVTDESVIGRAKAAGLFEVRTHNIRDYSEDKHHRVDDYPFGGSAGMLMGPQPLFDCIGDVKSRCPENTPVIYLSPCGKVWNNRRARELASLEHVILLCGHYEGVDQRVLDELVDEEISIGDYVLTGGELPAMVMIDTMIRFIPGVVGSGSVHLEESFEGDGLLEYPQYTRPADFRGMQVPEVLLSGNHAWLEKWRREQSLLRTRANRPDLLEKAPLTAKDLAFLSENSPENG